MEQGGVRPHLSLSHTHISAMYDGVCVLSVFDSCFLERMSVYNGHSGRGLNVPHEHVYYLLLFSLLIIIGLRRRSG